MKRLLFCVLALATVGFCQDKKLTAAEASSAVVTKVEPFYPDLAKQLNISGVVELEAVVGESGSVEKVNIVSGNPVLTRAGAEALMRWKFRPALADGKPVRVVAPVTFKFVK